MHQLITKLHNGKEMAGSCFWIVCKITWTMNGKKRLLKGCTNKMFGTINLSPTSGLAIHQRDPTTVSDQEHYSPQSISSMAGLGPCNTANIIGSSANCCMNISDQHHDVIFSANIKNCHHARISWKCQSVSVSSKKGKKLSKNKFILHHSHFVICFFMHKTWPFSA